ncbi:hypothetical protein SAMN04488515_3605 [Cognatiyoonia koreensis]|uniref:MOSC domain-containing protein n=1 Tax=Cognatiyoonia koreensis TaxID=364200 RepID=A0A1I0S0A0_9RHOB|nr:MOSC domain-containing protein [Cognatiyoonia koreensis]SEW47400.1 hypothetical protein SAMN04488515_3605 [Cognatiyoonia koreensis]
MITVASLWRHPIKSHGREALESVTLLQGQTMPFDRHWAVTHEKTHFDSADPKWEKCRNFMIGTLVPGLAGIWARLDDATNVMELRHVDLGTISFNPDTADGTAAFLNWVAPLTSHVSAKPTNLVSTPGRGMTDTPFPSVSIMNMASHRAVGDKIGQDLEFERWRGNIWLDGPDAWAEWDWIGKDIAIGDAVLHVQDRCTRCNHTKANPVTGLRDIDTLSALRNGWDHTDFGVYCTVIQSGKVSLGDTAEVL